MTSSTNLTVLVTGASRGIGRAIALQLARDGFCVVVHGSKPSAALDETLELITQAGGKARPLTFDVCDREAAQQALLADVEANGAYYGIVVNAGIARDGTFAAMSSEDWDSVIHTDLSGFYNVVQPMVMPMVRSMVRISPRPQYCAIMTLAPEQSPSRNILLTKCTLFASDTADSADWLT